MRISDWSSDVCSSDQTGRDLPTRGELDALLRTVKRWGIARRLEDDDVGSLNPLQEQSAGGLAIRPAIVDVLGETALMRLAQWRSEEHTSELQSLMRSSYAVFCLQNKIHRL